MALWAVPKKCDAVKDRPQACGYSGRADKVRSSARTQKRRGAGSAKGNNADARPVSAKAQRHFASVEGRAVRPQRGENRWQRHIDRTTSESCAGRVIRRCSNNQLISWTYFRGGSCKTCPRQTRSKSESPFFECTPVTQFRQFSTIRGSGNTMPYAC